MEENGNNFENKWEWGNNIGYLSDREWEWAGRSQGVARVAKATPIPFNKNLRHKQLIIFTTFTLHIKLHSELQRRRNALNVL